MSNDDVIIKTKVLIKASTDNTENLLSFPFLHAIHKLFDRLEIDILIDEGVFNVFKLLPFDLNIYEVPKKKSSLAGIHHFSYNLNDVFNVDYFFDFKGDFKGSFFGITFNAHERIGFATGLNKFFLTKKVEMKGRPTTDTDYLNLLATISEEPFTEKVAGVHIKETPAPKLKIVGDGEEDVVPELPPKKDSYLFVIIEKLFLDHDKNRVWFDFFDCFIDERFAIFFEDVEVGHDEDAERKDTIINFFDQLDERNKYISIPELTPETFKTIALEASSIITNQKWRGLLGAYLGKKSYTFVRKDQRLLLDHFAVSPELVLMDACCPIKVLGAVENTSIDDMAQLVDIIQGLK